LNLENTKSNNNLTQRTNDSQLYQLIENQNKVYEQTHDLIRENQLSIKKLYDKQLEVENINDLKKEISDNYNSFQNTFYNQTYTVLNKFQTDLNKFEKIYDDFNNHKTISEQKIQELQKKLDQYQNLQKNSQIINNLNSNNANYNNELLDAIKMFDPNQLDQFTSGISQMKEYIDNIKKYAEQTNDQIRKNYKKMAEEQQSLYQFHIDRVQLENRSKQFLLKNRERYIDLDYDYQNVYNLLDDIRKSKFELIEEYNES